MAIERQSGAARKWWATLAVAGLCLAAASAAAQPQPKSPAQEFGPLYADVQLAPLFPDSKTFADAVPRRAPSDILAGYRSGQSKDELRSFVLDNFTLPTPAQTPPPLAITPLREHIAALWPALARAPHGATPNSSQLAMTYGYVVPGGRFREVYYWDSYFTMLGLMADGRADLARGLTDNFADLIERYGHVPNGARTYYLTRSQPPVFFLMTGLLGQPDAAQGYAKYLSALRKEHSFWMRGEDAARPDRPVEHVVRFANGDTLNRYWDASDAPRDEAYRVDVRVAQSSTRPAPELYRELRSGAESGWDFSSRWMADGHSLATLRTTEIAPVDLNSLLFGLERAIAQGCARVSDRACAKDFTARAEARRRAIDRYLWDAAQGQYLDFDWRSGHRLTGPTAATLYPLFVGVASPAQARAVATATRAQLVAQGGLRTTIVRSGQQWDAPNGWAPLQWIAVSGLDRYGERALADDIAGRWVATVCRVYGETGKLLEKYDVEEPRAGGGGEYPLQDGFGWTNGVTRALLDRPHGSGAKEPSCVQPSQAAATP